MNKVLVIGASGYVGARLVLLLSEHGYNVKAASRSLSSLERRSWAQNSNVELCEADALNLDSLRQACEGCDAVYYLVHSMNAGAKDFEAMDRQAAQNMIEAAKSTEVQRIIYLGGLGEEGSGLSNHLKSRIEVAKIFQESSVPATTLRAAMIIGAGSASFEILRYLVKRLPVMITPRWVSTESQPIAISNVLYYLVECLSQEETKGQVFDIGGPEILSYRELMMIYAEEAKLPARFIIPVPVLTPRLSSYWIHLVTPISASIARPLAEGLRNRVVCQNDDIQAIIPQRLLNCRGAIQMSLGDADVKVPEKKCLGDPAWVN